MTDTCDVCGCKTDLLLDYFALVCQSCALKYRDINFLYKIGIEKEFPELKVKRLKLEAQDKEKTITLDFFFNKLKETKQDD